MSKKTIILLSAAGILLFMSFILWSGQRSGQAKAMFLGQARMYVFSGQDEPNHRALLRLTPLVDIKEAQVVNIYLDVDKDGNFSDSERVIREVPVSLAANWQRGFYVSSDKPLNSVTDAKVAIGDKFWNVAVNAERTDLSAQFDLQNVTNPEEAMKGWIVNQAWAQGEYVEITTEGVSDITQKPGECAPTAAANGLGHLMRTNGQTPPGAGEMIEDLKNEMSWTRENGVLPDDFVRGKNAWAQKHGIPIITEKVGDKNGLTTIDSVRQALSEGKAVELRVAFAGSGNQPTGGHMVSVTGIHQGEGQTYLDINDPATPEGTDNVEIRGNVLTNYGAYGGTAILSWAFTQSWRGEQSEDTSYMPPAEKPKEVRQYINYIEELLPVEQLRIGEIHPPQADGSGCLERHWHADAIVTAQSGYKVEDPRPTSCGFGTLSEKPIIEVPIY